MAWRTECCCGMCRVVGSMPVFGGSSSSSLSVPAASVEGDGVAATEVVGGEIAISLRYT